MAEWDALPPRRKQRRSDHSTCEESAKLVKKEPATKKLAESLLSSKDGVGSEFYECREFVYLCPH